MVHFVNDDLGVAPAGYTPPIEYSLPISRSSLTLPPLSKKVIAVIPTHGRHELLKHTITRLLTKNRCAAVVCAGDDEDRQTCEKSGANFIEFSNKYLGEKWNACFAKAQKLGAEVVLFVGSSDWVSDTWLDVMLPYTDKYDLVGKAGCYFLDISDPRYPAYSNYKKQYPREYRLVYWPGYKYGNTLEDQGKRSSESIGIGRLITARALDKLDWRPFHNHLNSSLDYNMFKRIPNNRMVYNGSIKALSLSTDRWPNKHKFEEHWNNILPSKRIFKVHEFCKEWFPEYNQII